MAISAMMTMPHRPASATRLETNANHARPRAERSGLVCCSSASGACRAAGAGTDDRSPAPCSGCTAGSDPIVPSGTGLLIVLLCDARVEHTIEDIGQQIHHHDQERRDDGCALDHRVVAG